MFLAEEQPKRATEGKGYQVASLVTQTGKREESLALEGPRCHLVYVLRGVPKMPPESSDFRALNPVALVAMFSGQS